MKTATAIALSLALTAAFASSAFAKKPGFEMPKKCPKQECHTEMVPCPRDGGAHHHGHAYGPGRGRGGVVAGPSTCPKQVCKTVYVNCGGNQ